MSDGKERLSDSQREERDRLIREVSGGLSDCLGGRLKAGRALIALRDNGLYVEHGSFDYMVRAVFRMSHGRAYQLMDAVAVIEGLRIAGVAEEDLPTHESWCRALVPLKDAQGQVYGRALADAWESVLTKSRADKEPITAKMIARFVRAILNPQWKREPEERGPQEHPARIRDIQDEQKSTKGPDEHEPLGAQGVHKCGAGDQPKESVTLPVENPSIDPPLDVMASAVTLLASLVDKVTGDPKWKDLTQQAQSHLDALRQRYEARNGVLAA
jgi:hypothetical protein